MSVLQRIFGINSETRSIETATDVSKEQDKAEEKTEKETEKAEKAAKREEERRRKEATKIRGIHTTDISEPMDRTLQLAADNTDAMLQVLGVYEARFREQGRQIASIQDIGPRPPIAGA